MADMNFSVRTGRFVNDPELRTSDNGKQFIKFTLAVNARKGQADFFEYIVWNENARYIDRYVRKGTKVWVLGTDRTDTYTDKNGVKRKSFTTACEKISIVGSRAAQEAYEKNVASEEAPASPNLSVVADDDLPF